MTDRIQLAFDDPAVFREEYASNIVKGGAFVPTSQRFEPRSVVNVEIELGWCNEILRFEAEIVHCTPEGTDPRHAGVAVQFLVPVSEVCARLEPFTEAVPEALESETASPDAVPEALQTETAFADAVPEALEMETAFAGAVPESLEADTAFADADALEMEDELDDSLDAGLEPGPPLEPALDSAFEASPAPEAPVVSEPSSAADVLEDLDLADGVGAPEIGVNLESDAALAAEIEQILELDRPDAANAPAPQLAPAQTPALEADSQELELTLEHEEPATAQPALELAAQEAHPTDSAESELMLDEGAAVAAPLAPATPAGTEADTLRGGPSLSSPFVDWSERRKSPRDSARVPIHVDSSHISLDGRTRDLSETGVLLSADASDLPLGKKVQLSLTHPTTGERLMVGGTVARHVEGGGTVAAVGIEFDTLLDSDDHLSSFINDVKAADNARRETGINGVIEELGIVNLLQMFGKSSRQGTFTAASGAEEGVVAFEGGDVRYVRLGSLRGTKALARMLSWEFGVFEFAAHVDALPEEDEPIPVEAAILDAVRQLDEAARFENDPIAPTHNLSLNRDALATSSEALSQIEEAVLDLAAAGLTVRRLLDVIPESDAQILEALASLRGRGIITLTS